MGGTSQRLKTGLHSSIEKMKMPATQVPVVEPSRAQVRAPVVARAINQNLASEIEQELEALSLQNPNFEMQNFQKDIEYAVKNGSEKIHFDQMFQEEINQQFYQAQNNCKELHKKIAEYENLLATSEKEYKAKVRETEQKTQRLNAKIAEERKQADSNHRNMKRKIKQERDLCKFYAKFFGFNVETLEPNKFRVKMEHAGLHFTFRLQVLEDSSIDYSYEETNSQAQAPDYMYQEVNFDATQLPAMLKRIKRIIGKL